MNFNFNRAMFRSAIRIDQWLASSPILRKRGAAAKTVFFPGCSLAAYNPCHVLRVRDLLKKNVGECGVLMACCAKPLRLMGERKAFQRRLDAVLRDLDAMGAETVVTACQSCFMVLREHGEGRRVVSLWPLMSDMISDMGSRRGLFAGLEVSVQDSCVTRGFPEIGRSVREILTWLGIKIREMDGRRFECCGGIQMLTTGDLRLGREHMKKRAAGSPCPTIVSYCASCRSAMGISGHRSLHILDLVFGDDTPQSRQRHSGLLNRWRTGRRI